MNKSTGRKIVEKLVSDYKKVRDRLIKPTRFLSEQDITTKFVLPMMQAFGWDIYKITDGRVEVKEKAYKGERAKHGLPDISLTDSSGKKVYIEVKKPWVRLDPKRQLQRYKKDSDVILLTSFECSIICAFGGRRLYIPENGEFKYSEYSHRFNDIWEQLSNTKKGRTMRAHIKEWAKRKGTIKS